MTEMSSSSPLVSEFNTLASAAGFSRSEKEPSPLDTALWRSDFAILALVRVREADAVLLDQAFIHSTEWISRLLTIEEKHGRLIDGYLVLAMPSKPDDALLTQVRRIESDTSVCRKHVLWPDQDLSWSSALYSVTTLGLPAAAPVSGEMTEPELPWAAKQALAVRDRGTSYEEVASFMEDLAEDESERNQNAN